MLCASRRFAYTQLGLNGGQIVSLVDNEERARAALARVQGLPAKMPVPCRLLHSADLTEVVRVVRGNEQHMQPVLDVVLLIFDRFVLLARRSLVYRACGRVREARQTYIAHISVESLLAAAVGPEDEAGAAQCVLMLRWARTRMLLCTPSPQSRQQLLEVLASVAGAVLPQGGP